MKFCKEFLNEILKKKSKKKFEKEQRKCLQLWKKILRNT